ncbi:amidohydrolase family protein [Nocardiopsis composta]
MGTRRPGRRADPRRADRRGHRRGEAAGTAAHTEDAAGRLVVPGFVDGHAHLDKTLWGGPWVPNAAGPGLAGRIAHGRDRRAEAGVPDPDKIAALLRNMVALGTVHARSHVDVDPDLGLDGVAAVREALRRLDGRISAELVAFPQTGLLTSPGTEQLMDRALKEGWRSSAASTRPGWTATRCATSTPSSAWPSGTAPRSTCTCTTGARWAPGSTS